MKIDKMHWFIIFLVFSNTFLFAEKPQKRDKKISEVSVSSNTVQISLPDAVQGVIKNNLVVKNAILEILKIDSPYLKNSSKFNWKLVGDLTYAEIHNPINNSNLLSGTKIQNNKIAAGIEKQFETGTYFYTEVSTVRFDSNAFEANYKSIDSLAFSLGGFGSLAIPPLYTSALSFKITQELWKYSFGTVERNNQKVLRNKSIIDKDQTVFLLTNIVAKLLIDYWSLSVQESAVVTFENLYKNAKNIRDITAQKQRIGIAESFELNQWNSVVESVEAQLERDNAQRNLKRILGIDSKLEIHGVTELSETIPPEMNYEKDLEYAYAKRIDLKNLAKLRENAKLLKENALEEDAPSIKVSASYSTRAQNFYSVQENYYNHTQGMTTLKFPEMRGELNVSYPLWDKGIKGAIRDAEVNVEQLKSQEKALREEIAVDLKNRIDAIESSYRTLEISRQTVIETRKYYNGLYEKFRLGRFTALQVKNALDSLTQAELSLIQSRVNFNINLIRYDLVKNSIFDKYGIDPDTEIEQIVKGANDESRK